MAAGLSLVVLAAGCSGNVVTVREMIGDASYWPPACNADPCVLTGNGGITDVWERHVDTNLARGRQFVVKGLCASACEIAARRAHARLLPGAKLIVHEPRPAVIL
ncbi:hypothetical protein ASC89_00445 [Devosia sp. Root413D1]|nr:hypothetical protein ASC89_00445 [Devosia sp. Root413D1]